jgi:DNA-binding response OmpR family regulator
MGSGKRVLLVEDDVDVRDAIADRLKHSGFVVHEAGNGFSALSEMRIRHFHVVITDCNMPGLDGFEFLRQCRQDHPSTPVIILSAGSTSTKEFPSVVGAFACLQKPFNPDQLVALVRQAAGLPPLARPPER